MQSGVENCGDIESILLSAYSELRVRRARLNDQFQSGMV